MQLKVADGIFGHMIDEKQKRIVNYLRFLESIEYLVFVTDTKFETK